MDRWSDRISNEEVLRRTVISPENLSQLLLTDRYDLLDMCFKMRKEKLQEVTLAGCTVDGKQASGRPTSDVSGLTA